MRISKQYMEWDTNGWECKKGMVIKMKHLSIKKLYLIIGWGTVISMMAIALAFYGYTGSGEVLWCGIALTMCALGWFFLLASLLSRRLSEFTADLCQTLDGMMDGEKCELEWTNDSETLFARISHRLLRLYDIMQESRQQAYKERKELQALISDISHQVKTPVSNLRAVVDTLLLKEMTEQDRREFLQGMREQTDKLDFLFQALVKTSRLESGVIQLEKKRGRLFETIAEALSGIVYAAERKNIAVTVDCPEDMELPHDRKWTSEALFNLLDNGVKYTSVGGKIHISVKQWEIYAKIDISDTGKGIPESRQATIFRRFYREEEVHSEPGVGIGLYLAREIITMQRGYIKVASEVGKGSVFSVFLPR